MARIGSTAPVLTVPAEATIKIRLQAGGAVCFDLNGQGGGVHALVRVSGNPAQGIGTEAEKIGGFPHPGVGFAEGISDEVRGSGVLGAHGAVGVCAGG